MWFDESYFQEIYIDDYLPRIVSKNWTFMPSQQLQMDHLNEQEGFCQDFHSTEREIPFIFSKKQNVIS